MKMLVWRAPGFLAPLLRRLFPTQKNKKRKHKP